MLKKLRNKIGIITGKYGNYPTRYILCKRLEYLFELKTKWSVMTIEDLVALAREAGQQQHYFEQLQILAELAEILLTNEYDRSKLKEISKEICSLEKIFCMDHEEFRKMYTAVYLSNNNPIIHKELQEYLTIWFDIFNRTADTFVEYLHPQLGVICGKAALQITHLSQGIQLEDILETYFMVGTYSIHTNDIDGTIGYYSRGLEKAIESNDITYQFIGALRIIGIIQSSYDFASVLDYDRTIDKAMQHLAGIADKLHTNLSDLGMKLVSLELENPNDMTKFRIERLSEIIPMLGFNQSLANGNREAAFACIKDLDIAEQKAGGSTPGISTADLFRKTFMNIFTSPYREESASTCKIPSQTDFTVEDRELMLNLPEGISPAQKLKCLHTYILEVSTLNMPLGTRSLCAQALEITDDYLSDYSAATIYSLLGKSERLAGRVDLAINAHNQILALMPKNTLRYIQSLLELGDMLKENNPEASVDYLTEALNLGYAPTLLKASIHITRAKVYQLMNNREQVDKDCIEALILIMEQIRGRAPYVKGEFKEKLWEIVRRLIGETASLTVEESSNGLKTGLYNAVLCAKGFMLSSERSIKDAIYTEPELSEYIPLYEKCRNFYDNRKKWGEQTDVSAEEYVNLFADEMKFTIAANKFIDKYCSYLNISFATVKEKLSEEAVVVDYFNFVNIQNEQEYMAFVYRKDSEFPKIVKVCKETDLGEIFHKMKADHNSGYHSSLLYNCSLPYGHSMRKILWDKIASQAGISTCNQIYFVPSGSINKIVLESLPADKFNEYATLEECYKGFYRLSSARETLNSGEFKFKDIALFGGLDYEEYCGWESKQRGYCVNEADGGVAIPRPWGNLAMTSLEVNHISMLLEGHGKSGTPLKYMGKDGTAEQFLSLSESQPTIIHVATHGFFETPDTAAHIPAFTGKYRPMDLCGLVMSKGNLGWLYEENKSKGILSATDISHMDLGNTELVVLSACNTGDGKIHAAEIYGLQRGFKKAGAHTLVMSLWNEYDHTGYKFMASFYHLLAQNGFNIRKAFYGAKKEIRETYPDPAYWAGFILID